MMTFDAPCVQTKERKTFRLYGNFLVE